MALRTVTCRSCPQEFIGGPRAWYCPSCRAERKRIQTQRFKQRKRDGKVREIGSTDICQNCGKSYIVAGGNQKYCTLCGPVIEKEVDNQLSTLYYYDNKDSINAKRRSIRFTTKICPVCKREFKTKTSQLTCSGECQRIRKNQLWNEQYHKKKQNDNKGSDDN